MTVAEIVTALQDRLPKNFSLRGLVQSVNEVVEDIRGRNRSWSFWYKQGSITILDEYTTGTVSVTNGSATVTGSGTTFTSGMVGRKIRVNSGEAYVISAYSSATSITLAVAYAGTTASAQTYSIYQDAYDLPTDCETVLNAWDASNRRYIIGVPPEDINTSNIELSPSGQWVRSYGQFGWNSTTSLPQLIFHPEPTEAALIYLWYYKRPTAVTGPGSTPDLPTFAHNVVLLGTLWKYTKDQGDEVNYRAALENLVTSDRNIVRDVVVGLIPQNAGPGFDGTLERWTTGQSVTGY